MKLTALILLVGCLQANASVSAQDISIAEKDASLKEIFKEIEHQSNYYFVYRNEWIKDAQKIHVSLKDATIREALDACLKDQPLTYSIIDNNVIIRMRPVAEQHTEVPAFVLPDISVTGHITDSATGNPITGATIQVEGTHLGTTSDMNGEYSLDNVPETAVLMVSYLGYRNREVPVSGKNVINVSLAVSTTGLSQLVVVGYGTQQKNVVTGAISTLDNKALTETKNENVVNMLTGKIPGLRVQQLSSEPGSFNTHYDIRGLGTPLIVIDGVPRSSGDLSRMDPNEIQSISVLKDASAAIYGVESANGVILVTTKRGKMNPNDKFNITYSVNQTWQQFLDVPDGVNAFQYMELANEQSKSTNFLNFFSPQATPFSDSVINLYKSGKLQSTNWMKAITRKLAPEIQHNISMNGGTEKVNYFFNLGYFKQGSLFKTNAINYDRWNFRSNVNVKISDRLKAQVLLSGYTDQKNQPGAGTSVWNIFKYAENLVPTDQIYANDDPAYPHLEPDNDNPVALIDPRYVGTSTYRNKNYEGQLSLDYDIPGIKGLSARGMYNYELNIADNNIVKKSFDLYQYDPQNEVYLATLVGSPSTVQRQYYTSTNTLMQLSLDYKRTFGGAHHLDVLALYEEKHSEGDDFSSQRDYSLGIPYLFAGDNNADQIAGMDPNALYEFVTKSLIGRLNYDYKGRYLLEGTLREDASSRFSPAHRWGMFPAVLAGWRISEEPFMQALIAPEVLSNLKIRASYGLLGDDGPVQYQWVAGYNYPGPGAILGGSYVNGLTSRGVTNDDLTWLKSKSFDAGVDVDLWNGLVSASFDYFVRNRDGLLGTVNAQLPGTVGVALPQQNLNSDQTRGVELLLGHKQVIGQVGYNVSGNISISRTRNRFVEETPASSAYDNYRNAQSGRYTNIWWGYIYQGQFDSYDQIYSYPTNTGGGNQSVLPGDYYYKDLNHDGVIDSKDQVPIATRDLPIVNFGLSLGANWRGFDASVLLQGATDFYVQYAEQLAAPLMYGRSSLTQFLDRWHPADPDANLFDPSTVWVPGTFPVTGHPEADENTPSTKGVQNASYMRIKSLEVGYSLPKALLGRFGVQSLRVYVNSYNLATLTGLKNMDPEHPGVVAQGADWNYSQGGYLYPENRTFSVGASITF